MQPVWCVFSEFDLECKEFTELLELEYLMAGGNCWAGEGEGVVLFSLFSGGC